MSTLAEYWKRSKYFAKCSDREKASPDSSRHFPAPVNRNPTVAFKDDSNRGPIIYLWNFVLTLGIMGDVAKHTWSTARRAMPNRQISQVLQGHKLVSATPSLTVREAVVSMADHNVGALVILDGSKRLVGIFTERDLLIRVVAKGLNPDAVALDEVMTRNPVTVSITDKVRIAMAEMYENKLRHLPVLDHGEVVGILSMRDFVGTEIQELEQVAEFEERIWETTG